MSSTHSVLLHEFENFDDNDAFDSMCSSLVANGIKTEDLPNLAGNYTVRQDCGKIYIDFSNQHDAMVVGLTHGINN
jgi:K+ transporter